MLIRFHLGWLRAVPEREEWCRAELARCLNELPPRLPFEMPESVGDRHWDTFAAECGVLYLAEDPSDGLARALVAFGVTAFRYTSALRSTRASFHRIPQNAVEAPQFQVISRIESCATHEGLISSNR